MVINVLFNILSDTSIITAINNAILRNKKAIEIKKFYVLQIAFVSFKSNFSLYGPITSSQIIS